jgi:prepilin signal peptidase PulO-like enzyme (type II secretory pathway)
MLFFEWILLAIGTVGFGLGAYWDLKTTEFPDWLPYCIIISALAVRGAFSYVLGDWWILFSSAIVGLLFLGFGLLLYYSKQWGDGDAWLLGSIGFLFPSYSVFEMAAHPFQALGYLPFPVIVLFNFFFLSFCYLVIYSIALGLRHRKISKKFWKELRKDSRNILLMIAGFAALCIAMVSYLNISLGIPLSGMYNLLSLPVIFAAVIVFIRYGRFVEHNLFKKRIPAGKLRVGDVLIGEKWKGLSESEIRKLRRKGGKVWIKEGVRFAPVFIITLYVTLFFGSLLWIFV